ncbi:hypothetical protein CK222_21650 [Mesorhizobium sp. WSM3866]|uniref:hypothetical protein n=1 Tax=Mesorhizobium sp. WSM3866 TaxID=422271 RepID=UPI000BAF28A2|nr:hypothetical protein [Mesorhizobium sp. WSM3866]PBB41763.1 hypothetical protein CK222_21650 [Mesorhizobium sp. WSM3866]
MTAYMLQQREGERTVKHGRRRPKTTTLKSYDVLNAEGKVIGRVMHEMATFERKPRGQMWVTSRWHSPRWFYQPASQWKRSIEYTSRKQAIEALLLDVASKEAVE